MFSKWNMLSCTVFRVCDGFAHALSLMSALLNMVGNIQSFAFVKCRKPCRSAILICPQCQFVEKISNTCFIILSSLQAGLSNLSNLSSMSGRNQAVWDQHCFLWKRFAVISSIHKTSTVPCELWHGSSSISYPCFFAGWKTKWKLYET